MRREVRNRLDFLCRISLLLCLGTCILWMRSYWWTDRIVYYRTDQVRWLQSEHGEIMIQVEADGLTTISADGLGLEQEPNGRASWREGFYDLRGLSYPVPPNTIILREWGGFWWNTMSNPARTLTGQMVAPFWGIALVLGALPLGRIVAPLAVRARAQRRKAAGLCPECRYDLRASSDRCPECGAVVA